MIRVEVHDDGVQERTIVAKATGKAYLFREQVAYAHIIDAGGRAQPYPSRVTVQLADAQPPYAKGAYTIAAESIIVNRFGQLDLGRLVLKPMAQSARQAA